MPPTRRHFIRTVSMGTLAATAGLQLSAETFRNATDTPKRIIIDSDTATDDALAILLALRSPKVKLEAVTITVGNVDFEQQVKNALYTIELAGQSGKVPVYRGSARPMLREVHGTATYVHGTDGMSDSFFPDPKQLPEKEHAVDAIIRLVEQYPNEITIVAIGPLTNIALALLRKPSIAGKIKALYFMGGFFKFYGNVTPAATYNIWVDPEAAKIVFQSKLPLYTVGFDISVKSSVFTDADYVSVAALKTRYADFFTSINRIRRVYCKEHQKMNGSNHPDAITMAIVIDPSISLSSIQRYADIETQGELTRGAMLVDELGTTKNEPNATICTEADEAKFKKLVFDTLK